MGAFEPASVAFFSAATREPFFASTTFSRPAADAGVALTGSRRIAEDGAEGHEGSALAVEEVAAGAGGALDLDRLPGREVGVPRRAPGARRRDDPARPVLDGLRRHGVLPRRVARQRPPDREVARRRGPGAPDPAGADRHRGLLEVGQRGVEVLREGGGGQGCRGQVLGDPGPGEGLERRRPPRCRGRPRAGATTGRHRARPRGRGRRRRRRRRGPSCPQSTSPTPVIGRPRGARDPVTGPLRALDRYQSVRRRSFDSTRASGSGLAAP